MARALLADADLPNKALQGKEELIIHCVACNQGCFDRVFQREPVTCMVNPAAGMETEFPVTPASQKKKVLIIGGGPAGMKAAMTASDRGHQVVLVEKSSRLGGQLLLNEKIPGREELLPADSIVMATGSKPENKLASLEDLIPELYVIGDAKKPRNALEAIKEGFLIGIVI